MGYRGVVSDGHHRLPCNASGAARGFLNRSSINSKRATLIDLRGAATALTLSSLPLESRVTAASVRRPTV
jgi:hypothetical protein